MCHEIPDFNCEERNEVYSVCFNYDWLPLYFKFTRRIKEASSNNSRKVDFALSFLNVY